MRGASNPRPGQARPRQSVGRFDSRVAADRDGFQGEGGVSVLRCWDCRCRIEIGHFCPECREPWRTIQKNFHAKVGRPPTHDEIREQLYQRRMFGQSSYRGLRPILSEVGG